MAHPKEHKIVVNGTQHVVSADTLTFDEIVKASARSACDRKLTDRE